jgi:gliding motility-associatede transport system auxiliary component
MSATPETAAGTRTQYRLTLGISIVVGFGILVLVNYLGSRHYRRFDWTRSGLYTLSDKTVNVLKDLKQPVTATVFMTESSPLWSETQEILRRYKAKSSVITVETLDPTRNRARAEQLVKEFGVRGDTVVFKSGDKKKYVTSDQLAELDFSRARMGGEPTIKAFKGEQEFTSAILSVTQTKTPKVVFTTGHGERRADSRQRDGFFALAETLRRDNCTVEDWQSLGAADVPAGTDAVVVAGPKTSFTEPEVAVLKKYLEGGGRALFFLDTELLPGGTGMSDLGLRGLLGDLGLRLDDDIVVDPKFALPLMGPETVFAGSFRSHPITRILEGSHVVFPAARSIGVAEKPPAGWTDTILVETSSDGWGETDLAHLESVKKDEKDVKGPVPLAAAAEKTAAPKSRVVAFGDADFASNGGLANAANLYLLSAAANWALERESLVAIPPKAADQVAVTLSRGDIGRMTIVSLLLLPLAAIGLGLAVWMKRRR